MASARYSERDGVAVVSLDNPPVNGLGLEVRTGIVDALTRAAADPAVAAVVLVRAGKGFSGGADIREIGSPRMTAEPTLHAVIAAVAQGPKPVVEGCASGAGGAPQDVVVDGGMVGAFACHYRVAARDAQVALPEVKLGLLPGAGGTQRLPRVVGLETALDMIVSGETVGAAAL